MLEMNILVKKCFHSLTCNWVQHPSMKESSLFCFFVMLKSPKPWHFMSHTLDIFGNLLMSKGALTWFETIWSYGVKAIDCWTIFSMKTRQNQDWKLYWNLRAFLVLLESPWQGRFNRIYFTIFKAKVWKAVMKNITFVMSD